MSVPLFPQAYEQMINDDIMWLEYHAEDSLERGHIIAVLKQSVEEYRERGYEEDMYHTGWRHEKKLNTEQKVNP